MQRVSLLAAAVMLSSGCIAEVRTVPPPEVPTGLLTVTWTVDGKADPDACRRNGVTKLELDVYDLRGRMVAMTDEPCEDMTASVELREGSYTASARLVRRGGEAATTSLPLDDVRIKGDTDLTIDVDFPAGSLR